MKSILSYLLYCAGKDKIFFSMVIGILISFLLCTFIGSTAAYEKAQMQIVYASGVFRILLVYGFAIFNAFFISRMLQNREIETFLAGPVSRKGLILSLIAVNSLLILILSIISMLLLKTFFWKVVPLDNALIWCISIFLEVLLVSSITVFFALMLSSTTATIFLVTIFYITSRIMGFILSSLSLSVHGVSFASFMKVILIPVSIFFPRLDLFSQSTWLIYHDTPTNISLILAQGVIYIPLITLACIVDFNKKSL